MKKYWVYAINSMGSTWYLSEKDANGCYLWSGASEEYRTVYRDKAKAKQKAKELDELYKFGSTRHYIQSV